MEHLSKQQIVLLTLLVSFVTSIATGIVAVSLMNQAPMGVSQTINQVVERTIERVVSDTPVVNHQGANVAAVATIEPETLAQKVEKVSRGVVKIKSRSLGENGPVDTLVGFGLVISKEGVIVMDKTTADTMNLTGVFADGKEFPLSVLQSQILGDVAFVIALTPRDYIFHPVRTTGTSTSMKLGTTVYALGTTLESGFINKEIETNADAIETSIMGKGIEKGSPLFLTSGEVVGVKTMSFLDGSSYYPLNKIATLAPVITH